MCTHENNLNILLSHSTKSVQRSIEALSAYGNDLGHGRAPVLGFQRHGFELKAVELPRSIWL